MHQPRILAIKQSIVQFHLFLMLLRTVSCFTLSPIDSDLKRSVTIPFDISLGDGRIESIELPNKDSFVEKQTDSFDIVPPDSIVMSDDPCVPPTREDLIRELGHYNPRYLSETMPRTSKTSKDYDKSAPRSHGGDVSAISHQDKSDGSILDRHVGLFSDSAFNNPDELDHSSLTFKVQPYYRKELVTEDQRQRLSLLLENDDITPTPQPTAILEDISDDDVALRGKTNDDVMKFWERQMHIRRHKRAPRKRKKDRRQRMPRVESTVSLQTIPDWHCSSHESWIDLGPQYFPRFVRNLTCGTHQHCFHGKAECVVGTAISMVVLKRLSEKCVDLKATINAQQLGILSVKLNSGSHMVQPWVYEEIAVVSCCECRLSKQFTDHVLPLFTQSNHHSPQLSPDDQAEVRRRHISHTRFITD